MVTVGHSLAYMITFEQIDAENNFRQQPFTMQASVSMSKIKSFADFDEEWNVLHIDGDKLTDADVGFYTVDVAATFTNGTHTEAAAGRFRLEIRADMTPVIIDQNTESGNLGPVAQDEVIYVSDWTGLIETRNSEASKFSPDQPVPYIHELTETGVLTIRWDRAMSEISDVTVLPPT